MSVKNDGSLVGLERARGRAMGKQLHNLDLGFALAHRKMPVGGDN